MNKLKTILVTGGAGYIGSHTCLELLQSKYRVIVVDNLSNSSDIALERVQALVNRKLTFIKEDLRDKGKLLAIFDNYKVDAVIHFAGLKAVGESVEIPLQYYQHNVATTLNLLEVMQQHSVTNIVFSSSATVYGSPKTLPIKENAPLSVTSPYGRSKLFIEDALKDLFKSNNCWNISILRYFNPVGAHKSGMIGEDPCGIPNNLMPYMSQVAVGKLKKLMVFGSDYDTKDGTGVRDYIHVVDLAKGHIKALEKLATSPGCIVHNLGAGQGYSVLDMLNAMEEATGKSIPHDIVARRAGDIATCYADPTLAKRELNWEAKKSLLDMCVDTWRWQEGNPNGYE